MTMEKKAIIRSLRINYFVSMAAALVVLLAFECGVVEKGALAAVVPSTAMYAVQVATIFLTVLLIPLAIKGFTSSLDKAKGVDEAAFIKLFCKKSLQRIFILFIVVVVNEFVYYGLGYDGALYCGLLGFGSMIYSFPTRMVLEQYLGNE
jgi:hypothetical protein